MAAKKKTSFYHTRNKICPNVKQAAELLGVEEAEILRMDMEGAPVYAERLLLMWDRSQIRAPGWDGWRFIRGALVHKNKRWRPENLLQLRNDIERLEQLENEIDRLHSFKGVIAISKKLISKTIENIIYRYAIRKLRYTSPALLPRAYRSGYWR